jgi:NADPH:quinone reductase-like Zn-dependent oxidoreductase
MRHHSNGADVDPSRSQLIEIARLIEAGELRPIVEATFPLAQARSAFERALRAGTIGVRWSCKSLNKRRRRASEPGK